MLPAWSDAPQSLKTIAEKIMSNSQLLLESFAIQVLLLVDPLA